MQEFFQALSSSSRLKILRELLDRDGWVCECKFRDLLDKDNSVIYRHFRRLEKAGILETRKNGRMTECKVKNRDKMRKIVELANEVTENG